MKHQLSEILKDEFYLVIKNEVYSSDKELKGKLSGNSLIEKKRSGSKPLGNTPVQIYAKNNVINLQLRKDSKNEQISWVFYQTKYMDYHLGYIKFDLEEFLKNNKL